MYTPKHYRDLSIAGIVILAGFLIFSIFREDATLQNASKDQIIGLWHKVGAITNGVFSKESELIAFDFCEDGTGEILASMNNFSRHLASFNYSISDSLTMTITSRPGMVQKGSVVCLINAENDSMFLLTKQRRDIFIRLDDDLKDLFLSQK